MLDAARRFAVWKSFRRADSKFDGTAFAWLQQLVNSDEGLKRTRPSVAVGSFSTQSGLFGPPPLYIGELRSRESLPV